MPEVVAAEAEAIEGVEPVEPVVEESLEAPDDSEADPKPSLAELITEETLSEVLEHPSVLEAIAEANRRAEQSARNKIQSEQRRSLNPQVVTQMTTAILQEAGLDPQTLTRSQHDRLNNTYATVQHAAAEMLAEEIPQAFFSSYELSDSVRADYLQAINAGETDRAMQTLVDGAVALKLAPIEAANEKRIETEVDKRVKQGLEAANQNGGPNLPVGSSGQRTGNVGLQLTSAELDAVPGSVWTKLTPEVKAQIKANIRGADESRGRETLDSNRVGQVAALAR